MRFDDTLETVLAADVSTPFGKASAWRQIVDLIGRGRASADPRALDLLRDLRPQVSLTVRAASARGLELAHPPAALVALCAQDEPAVAAPILRSAKLSSGEWIDLLPRLSAAGREVLRARRDLPAGVHAALASFAADFVIAGDGVTDAQTGLIVLASEPVGAAVEQDAIPRTPSTFVSVGVAALSLPVVAAALQQASDGEADAGAEAIQNETVAEPLAEAMLAPDSPRAHDAAMLVENLDAAGLDHLSDVEASPVEARGDGREGPFEISDVVARIDAFYLRQQGRPATPTERPRGEGFRFETDARGVIRWVDGVARAPLIGLSLDVTAVVGGSGVDGVVAGAFRQRTAFNGARLSIIGESDAAGNWRIAATPAFDPVTGRFAGYRGTARRPRAEEDAAPSRSRGQVADSLRQLMHELRTPTNAIGGFSEMIEREMLGEVASVYRERARTIRDHARALLSAIDDLDIAARIEASALQLQPRDVALRPLLARIAEDLGDLAARRGATVMLPADDVSIASDPRAVERLMSRLLATLLSAAGEGEHIVLDVREGDGVVMLSASRPQALLAYSSEALFGIDDEREDAALLGTGFALRLLRNLARELSGALVIEADRLTVRLPAAVTKSLEVVR